MAPMVERDTGAIALLVLAGGGLAMLIALVLLVTVADLFLSRGQAQVAADAAALAAMGHVAAGGAAAPRSAVLSRLPSGALATAQTAHRTDVAMARWLAAANGGELVQCCGDDPGRREVVVGVAPRSTLLRSVLPLVRARAAAALEAIGLPMMGRGLAGAAVSSADGRMWPVEGAVTSGFGLRTHPLTGQRRFHAGLDLAAASGTPIRAAAAGQIGVAGVLGGYGLTVDIRHRDGSVTRYAHQSRLLVRSGQLVAAGQVIGLVGSTGNSTGPHLHFEVRTPAGPIDPFPWLPS
jgi:murein DD-endopeptidase MepM/ murein hydrolase activator NlpD